LNLGAISILIGNSVSMMVRIVFGLSAFVDWRDCMHPNLLIVIRNICSVGMTCHAIMAAIGEKELFKTVLIVGIFGLFTIGSIARPMKDMFSTAKKTS
jgi:hypothetical protein